MTDHRIASRDEWVTTRRQLLAKEKEFLRQREQLISRAPLGKLQAFATRMGRTFNWVSAANSDFNYDYQVSFKPDDLAHGTAARSRTERPRRRRPALPHGVGEAARPLRELMP
jgi:predicted dithiol-disulfide oxidoreductase (DUF899 family)